MPADPLATSPADIVLADDGGPGNAALYRSIVEGSNDMAVVFDDDGTIVFASEASLELIGRSPAELTGRPVFDFIHPDDVERALLALDLNNEYGPAPGTTVFRVAHGDGSWVFVDVAGGQATDDGQRVLFSSFSRKAADRFAITETLMRLLAGSTVGDALRPVCDVFAWERNGSQIGISWTDGDHVEGTVSTGITPALLGGRPEPEPRADRTTVHTTAAENAAAAADDNNDYVDVWDETRRTGIASLARDLDRLTPRQRELARQAGMSAYWIEPVGSGSGSQALITVWTRPGGRPPLNHAHAMATVTPIVELILRWVGQQRMLDFAAFHDPLTGVANRARFFDALETSTAGGSILFCDLDRFKAVNDELGHAAGDELLRLVSARLLRCVRSGDLVARLGGDEFAVLCPGASHDLATGIAQRIEEALTKPFSVAGTSVSVGASIGVGHAGERLSVATLESADQALYRIKGERRAPRPT